MADGDRTTPGAPAAWRTACCAAAALVGFAGNSLLTRAAVGRGAIDAASFTAVRVATGALSLYLLVRLGAERPRWSDPGGAPAGALAAYMVAFSFAYERINASLGALLLFGSVQLTMTGWGLWRGVRLEWADRAGTLLALGGLLALLAPGLAAPDPPGACLMIVAGVAWGIYSLIGRGVADPLRVTAQAFARALPASLLVGALTWGTAHASARGVLLASLSGALASGVGYTLWYAALPALSAYRAALLQLLVPALTAVGAVVLLGEGMTRRLIAAGAMIVAGVALPSVWRGAVRRGR